jgi:hypothetical protein
MSEDKLGIANIKITQNIANKCCFVLTMSMAYDVTQEKIQEGEK